MFSRSLVYNMNSRGPRIEPCGTPISRTVDEEDDKMISSLSDVYYTYIYYDINIHCNGNKI